MGARLRQLRALPIICFAWGNRVRDALPGSSVEPFIRGLFGALHLQFWRAMGGSLTFKPPVFGVNGAFSGALTGHGTTQARPPALAGATVCGSKLVSSLELGDIKKVLRLRFELPTLKNFRGSQAKGQGGAPLRGKVREPSGFSLKSSHRDT